MGIWKVALVVSLPGDSMKGLSHLHITALDPCECSVTVKGAHTNIERFSGLCIISHFLSSIKGE